MRRLPFETLEQRNLLTADLLVIPTAGTNNVVTSGDFVYAAAGPSGLTIVDARSREPIGTIESPGSESVDDLAIAGDFLFALDGQFPGRLSVFSLENPQAPQLISGPIQVDVGPFAGVSAANGRVVVSGGTGLLSVHTYDASGMLGEQTATADLGTGQPDVLLAPNGEIAFVSTDFVGGVDGAGFGLTVIDVADPPQSPTVIRQIGIMGSGFTPGVQRPANFPIESALAGDQLFVAFGRGVSIYDVSDSTNVSLVDTIELDTNPVNVDVRNNQLFVVGRQPASTLSIIDIDELSTPNVNEIVLPLGADPLSVVATAEHVFVADANLGLIVVPNPRPPVGDIDRDGQVAFADFLILSSNFSMDVPIGTRGDLDADGRVGFSDFLLLAANFGTGTN